MPRKKREPSKCFVKPSEWDLLNSVMTTSQPRVTHADSVITYQLTLYGRKELNILLKALGLYEVRMPTEYEARMKATPDFKKRAQQRREIKRHNEFQALYTRVFHLKGKRV